MYGRLIKSAAAFFSLVLAIVIFGCAGSLTESRPEENKSKNKLLEFNPRDTSPGEFLKIILDSRGISRGKSTTYSGIRRSTGTYWGAPYTARSAFSPSSVRMDLRFGPSRELVVVSGKDRCWSEEPPVVHRCDRRTREESQIAFAMDRAALIFPLLKENWTLLKTGQKPCGEGMCQFLEVFHDRYKKSALLEFDSDTLDLETLSYDMHRNGISGKVEKRFSKPKEFCDLVWPTIIVSRFRGELFRREEISEIQCRKVDDKTFEAPDQVPDGTILLRSFEGENQACATMYGSYLGYGQGVARLGAFLEKRKWQPTGPLQSVLIAALPKTKKPEDFITELCFPIAYNTSTSQIEEGGVVVKPVPGHKALSIFSLGPYDENNLVLMETLHAEAKKRNLFQAGDFKLIRHTDISSAPSDEWVMEVQMPVK